MAITLNGTTGITSPEVTLDNAAADGGQVVLKSSGFSNWNIDNYSGDLRNYYGSTVYTTLTSAGNFGIGTASPAARLAITTSDALVFDINSTAASGGYVRYTASGTAYGYIGTATGIIGAGGTNALAVRSENAMMFATGGSTERMRIDSSGNLLVGTTSLFSGGEKLLVSSSSGDWTAVFRGTNGTAANNYGVLADYAQAPNGTNNWFFRGSVNNGSTVRFEVRSNGGIANYSANNVNLSDAREKTNVELAGSYLDKICAIPVKTFNYIDQNLEEDGGLTLGVIAQDVEAVAPELVMESNWGSKEEPKMRLSIYQTDLQYALMKCIQELKAELDTVKTELATLKGTA